MNWFDQPWAWDRVQGRKLVKLLARLYADDASTKKVLQDAGLFHLMVWQQVAAVRWHDIATGAHSAGQLLDLLEIVSDDVPDTREQFDILSRPDSVAAVGNPVDPYEGRLLGPEQRPMIDRAALRDHLRAVVEQRHPVLVIRGRECKGKSHSFELIKHIARCRDVYLVHIDLMRAYGCTSAVHLMAIICSRLRLPDLTTRDRQTTPLRHAKDLVHDLVGEFRGNTTRTIVVIDGLDRTDLETSLHDLVVALAVEITNDQLPFTQLVLAGYYGDFGSEVRYPLIDEIVPVTEAHVREFFDAIKSGLAPDVLDGYVREAMIHVDDMRVFEDKVRERALELVGRR